MRCLTSLCCTLLVLAGCSRGERSSGIPKPAPIPRFDAHAHVGPRDVGGALEIYGRQGIAGFANFSGGHGAALEAQLAEAREQSRPVLVFANVNPRGLLQPGWVEHEVEALRRARQRGAAGLKFYKALGLGFVDPQGERVPVDDPRLDPLFEEAGRLGMPVTIHTGDPQAFFRPATPDNERWDELSQNPEWSFVGPAFPSWETLFGEYERRVARHPKTRFVGVHFGNVPEDPARVSAMLRRYPNLYVDTAARLGEIGRMQPAALRAIFLEHRQRILFGTDFSLFDGEMTLGAPDGHAPSPAEADRFFAAHWRFFQTNDVGIAHPTPIQGRWTIDAIGLPEDVQHDVYHRNAERLFGLPPLGRPK